MTNIYLWSLFCFTHSVWSSLLCLKFWHRFCQNGCSWSYFAQINKTFNKNTLKMPIFVENIRKICKWSWRTFCHEYSSLRSMVFYHITLGKHALLAKSQIAFSHTIKYLLFGCLIFTKYRICGLGFRHMLQKWKCEISNNIMRSNLHWTQWKHHGNL